MTPNGSTLSSADSTPRAGVRLPRWRRGSRLAWLVGGIVTLVAVVVILAGVDGDALARTGAAIIRRPGAVVAVLAVYGAAFVLRALAWHRVLPRLGFAHALAAIHVGVAANHLLPFRLGEAVRVTSVVRRTPVGVGEATASTVALRAADIVSVAGLGLVVAPAVFLAVAGGVAVAMAVLAAVVAVAAVVWLARARARGTRIRIPGPVALAATVVSWALEAVVMWQAAQWAGVTLSIPEAVVVTAVTIAAQVAAIAPGGLGTYEAAATAALAALGVDPATGLAIAVTAHAVKTAYALVAGAVAAVVPAPGLLGRIRLPRHAITASGPALPPPAARPDPDAPVVLFLPAYDEQDRVGAVVARAPAEVHGHRVEVVVVDDGSRDATVTVARAAGARVVSMGRNRGLGAAVRRGLEDGVARGAAAIAFCDADGEYAPEELANLVGPILRGQADYVVGSRFKGQIAHMRPHRRIGNLVLTRATAYIARTPISDGQSGYRALSWDAARVAEVAHDYNYAQVLTLDLLSRGLRYFEVPISYRFRTSGDSFVRLGRYLRAVVPAVWRVVNRAPS